jgi:hypothetical protein
MTQYVDYDSADGYGRIVRPRARRWPRRLAIIVGVVIVLLVALDFAGRALAENIAASEIQKQGFPKKPSVSIKGFPFLTQVVARDFTDVQISATDVTEGPLEIADINATMRGVHVSSSFNGATVGNLNGTIDVTFTALANAMTSESNGLGSLLGGAGLSLSQAGPNEVKASINVLVASGTATWRVTRTGHNEISVQLVSSTGLGSDLLGSIGDINVPLPSLPLGLSIQSISVTSSGLVGTVTGQNVSFGS